MLYEGPRIDSDVHHNWKSDEDVIAYMPRRWQDYLRQGRHTIVPPAIFNPAPNGITSRLDAFPESGPPASDLELLRRQLLDPFRITHAILCFDTGPNVGLPNLELATELGKALNRGSIEHWLSGQDERIYGSVLVNTQLPEAGAADIREFGRHPRMSEALLVATGMAKPFGHPVYDPIHRAAVETDMPVAIHIGGDTFLPGGTATQTAAGGLPNTRFERHSLQMQPAHHYVTSFLVHGVFEKYPTLRLIIKETGIAWLPWFFWELDAAEPMLKAESSHLKDRPSDYLRRHLRVTTQPLEEPPRFEQLIDLLEALGGVEDMLCFSTDYPHHDTDDPDHIARRLPEAWWEKVFYRNALALYGWPDVGADRLAARGAGRDWKA
jgi:uncharacterized protein